MSKIRSNSLACLVMVAIGCPAFAQDEPGAADLAKELTNPIADLVTVPIQFNLDQNIGPSDDGTEITLNT